jgi:hypothetical protein
MRDWTLSRSAIVQNNYGLHLHPDLRLVAAEQRRVPLSLVVSKTAVFPAPLQVWPQLGNRRASRPPSGNPDTAG